MSVPQSHKGRKTIQILANSCESASPWVTGNFPSAISKYRQFNIAQFDVRLIIHSWGLHSRVLTHVISQKWQNCFRTVEMRIRIKCDCT